MSNSNKNVLYTFIGNINTIKKVAEYPISEKYNNEVDQIFSRMAKNKNSIKIGEISKIPTPKATYYLLVNKVDYFFLIIVDNLYVEDNAHKLLEELRDKKFETMLNDNSELNYLGLENLKTCITNFQNNSNNKDSNKLKEVQIELNDVKVEVRNCVKKELSNIEDARELEGKSKNISDFAVNFNENAEELKRATRKRNIIITVIVIAVVILLVIVITVPVVLTAKAAEQFVNSLNNTMSNISSYNNTD